jgi:hypothetical protein
MSNHVTYPVHTHATFFDYTLGGLTGYLSLIMVDALGWAAIADVGIKGIVIPLLAVITGTLGGALGKWMLNRIKGWLWRRFGV